MSTNLMIPAIQRFFDCEFIISVGRASLGIYAALRVWSGGRKLVVALPAAVCQDVIAAVLMAGCSPHLCDVDPVTGLVPCNEWTRARGAGATAAIVVHLYGNPADTALVCQIFSGADCLIIDDAAQALGTRTARGLAGTGGDVGVISFGATKHIEVGGAALIFRDALFARECERLLAEVVPTNPGLLKNLQMNFRQRYQIAHDRLVRDNDPVGFAGLLDGYDPLLKVELNPKCGREVAQHLASYPAALLQRQEKAQLWLRSIQGSGLVPIGMDIGAGCVPWRFACRLPGCDLARQYSLGEKMRAHGLQVSHWYLPGNWWLGTQVGLQSGAKTLASETFQFWLDENTAIETIKNAAIVLKSVFNEETLIRHRI
jgi:hypothetical protein